MFRSLTPAVRMILIANALVYGLQLLLGDPFDVRFALWPWHADERFGAPPFEIWQLVSYGFLHGSWEHIFFNMFAVYMFGPEIERLLGTRHFVIYYLVCVIGAALTQLTVLELFDRSAVPTVGASGGVFGLLLCFGMAYPHRKLLLLFPPIPLPAWLFVTLYGVFELMMGVFGTMQGVAHFAHLGGMAFGYLLLRFWRAMAGKRNARG